MDKLIMFLYDYIQIVNWNVMQIDWEKVNSIRNSTFDDELRCFLLDDGILNKCEWCSLSYICDEINKVVENYVDKTTEVVNNFNFE